MAKEREGLHTEIFRVLELHLKEQTEFFEEKNVNNTYLRSMYVRTHTLTHVEVSVEWVKTLTTHANIFDKGTNESDFA